MFDTLLVTNLGDCNNPPHKPFSMDAPNLDIHIDASVRDADNFNDYNQYTDTYVILPKDDERMRSTVVICRSIVPDGIKKYTSNHNPIIDTRIYNVMFHDGYT